MQVRQLVLGLLLVIPIFAGCLDDPDAVGAKGIDAKSRKGLVPASLDEGTRFFAVYADGTIPDIDVLDALEPVAGEQRFIGANTFEPTIGIDGKGNLFMVQFGGGAHIVASKDQGVTWTRVNPSFPVADPRNQQQLNNPPNSNDPFVWVDRDTGRIFMNDLQALVCSWMNFSDDEGATWTTNPIGCGHPFGVHDHQSITTGKARNLPSQWEDRIVYYCINRVGDTSCASSINGGLSFGPLVTILPGVDAETARLCGGLAGHAKADHEGRVFLGKNQCGVPMVAVTEDDGVNWDTYVVSREIGIRGHDVEIGIDEANNVYAFWLSDRGLPTLAVSKNNGKTWGPAFTVGAPGVTIAKFNAIAAGGVGKVAFTYMGNTVEGGATPEANYTGTMWHAYIGIITDALAENPLVQSTMVDSVADPVAINGCAGRCDGMGDFMDIQIDPFGRPWAALVDVCGEKCMSSFQTDPQSALHDGNKGFAGTLASGPALLTQGGALLPLPALLPAAPAQG
jgi:hypothetical protein